MTFKSRNKNTNFGCILQNSCELNNLKNGLCAKILKSIWFFWSTHWPKNKNRWLRYSRHSYFQASSPQRQWRVAFIVKTWKVVPVMFRPHKYLGISPPLLLSQFRWNQCYCQLIPRFSNKIIAIGEYHTSAYSYKTTELLLVLSNIP